MRGVVAVALEIALVELGLVGLLAAHDHHIDVELSGALELSLERRRADGELRVQLVGVADPNTFALGVQAEVAVVRPVAVHVVSTSMSQPS